ncbi:MULTISPECIES: hypothetical protein [Bacillus]|uniref:hypothetical protein n=2 Tax=Bacillaceae TaxID=186817 RepID=UPI000AB4A623|nr:MULTISPECIES: hypothetical protein [Bacillus]MDA1690263.1 hypothetical protein [Bacillus cereus group sp. TH147LC]MCX3302052.1 hypothetical protein [Bacillus pacificus]MDA2034594.1 hypothetical protein [Bacillus cereus group sp. Bcc02]MDK7546481.1 hypothetical protein [Bacillus pacificus]MDK7566047.1 hypothetical protein [Bacillus pacificus]
MMTQERLIEIQKKLAKQFMQKVDVYHSEKHRGILVVGHGQALHPHNILAVIPY